MIPNEYYTSEETQGKYELFELGDLIIEDNSDTLRNCELAYRTFGTLNHAKNNAILITTWFSGTGKAIEDVYVGPDHALNPDKYFIVVVDQIGSGTSSSPHNHPGPQTMAKFPKLRIIDDVKAQHQFLTRKYGLKELALVVGASMGGMQVYEWAVLYPRMVKRAALIACTARTSFHQQLFTESLEEALTSDPAWNRGWYSASTEVHVGIHRMVKIVTLLAWSTEFFQEKLWKTVLHMPSVPDLLNNVMKPYFEAMDPNALLLQLYKWRSADVSRHTNGDLAAALGKIKAKTCVMPISHDMFFPPNEAEDDQKLIAGSLFRVIVSKFGHGSIDGSDPNYMGQVDTYLNELLSS